MGSRLERFSDAHETMRYLKTCPSLVRCHRCAAMAIVRCGRSFCDSCGYHGVPNTREVDQALHRVSAKCKNCGQELTGHGTRNASGFIQLRCRCGGSQPFDMARLFVGSLRHGQEPRTGLPLWLRADFRGRVLWAVNERHLSFLERFVAAGIREQCPGNSSLASRLPAWIKSAKHRPALVAALRKLRATLPADYDEHVSYHRSAEYTHCR
ncbi:hypothetical protein FB566_2154 [Stackebrandtia endophytica]|uniref:Replication restart DNA helicase PriA n=1 Tax=Stackebrandtia endophytica TaxID=1496996 RepID=A0A543AVQ6_9ACTN|nr:hypothetical protein [Stackebrandtia endophytica]TQL76621.1 hypothetical protein FB566_2154 [Stackebrandtia endophytica]